MNPFVVLGLEADATNQDIEERYLMLVQKYPPDQAPDFFPMLRQAYEDLQSEEDRLNMQLLYFDASGQALTEDLPKLPRSLQRKRLSFQEMKLLVQHCQKGA